MISEVKWSTFRELLPGGRKTVDEALEDSGLKPGFDQVLADIVAKTSRHEQVTVLWWHSPYVYVTVKDSRWAYPYDGRALVSFDITNGLWASFRSERRYVYARRGWKTFLDQLTHQDVPLYSDEGREAA